MNEDTEITLKAGALRLKAAPFGASLRGLWREAEDGTRRDIVTGYTGAKGKVGGQGDVLIPFPGRVRDGHYRFAGQDYQMLCNDKDGPNAIHGFLRLMQWEIAAQTEREITFAVTLDADAHPGYPFALHTALTYTLDPAGMTCRFRIENSGQQAAPVAAGFHPYLTVGTDTIDTALLHVPMESTLEFVHLIPTGRVLSVTDTAFDFRSPHPIGATQFNTCYLNPLPDGDGLCRIHLAAPDKTASLTVCMDSAFRSVVLYSGDPLPDSHRRRALAIEPMTCASDAFNHPEWGLITLPPGKVLTGCWQVRTPVDS